MSMAEAALRGVRMRQKIASTAIVPKAKVNQPHTVGELMPWLLLDRLYYFIVALRAQDTSRLDRKPQAAPCPLW